MNKITSSVSWSIIMLGMICCVSCTKELKISPEQYLPTPESVKAKPGTISEVKLKITVNDNTGNKITSDGGGDYVNGSQYIKAIFDQYGNFMFGNTEFPRGSHNLTAIRWFTVNLGELFSGPGNPPSLSNATGFLISTIKSDLVPNSIPLQSLALNQSQCMAWTLGVNSNGNIYRLNFHRGLDDTQSSPTSYAVFTRISSTQWQVTPLSTCSINSNVAALRQDADPAILFGYYNVPFSFTLTAL